MQNEDVKEIYNKFLKQEEIGDYEFYRWSTNSILRSQYFMTLRCVLDFLTRVNSPARCLEVGPGPGTWTKKICEKFPQTNFTLVDISEEMLGQAKKNLSSDRINFFVSDFLQFSSLEKYQLFFSSRALEYFVDKNNFFLHLEGLLDFQARGFVITKTPHYFLSKLRGSVVKDFHSWQIAPQALRKIIEANGFKVIKIRPVTMRFPGVKIVFVNDLLFKLFHSCRMNFILQFLSESYSIEFEKL